MTSGVFTTRSPVRALKHSQQNWSAISASSLWHKSGNSIQRPLHMMYEQQTVQRLYKKLINLYPPGFKERLAESMEQTFQDLWNEKRQTKKELFSFVLWMFIETAIGIFREHLLLISPGNLMQSILKFLGSSALISLLLILPFMIMEV